MGFRVFWDFGVFRGFREFSEFRVFLGSGIFCLRSSGPQGFGFWVQGFWRFWV